MQKNHNIHEGFPVSEMAIVDTFTKLIFADEDSYTASELLIVQAFRAVDVNVLRDTHLEMGEYLRNLGVSEMIQLVASVREQLHVDVQSCAAETGYHGGVDAIGAGRNSVH